MKRVGRICISVPVSLLAEFDEAIRAMGYPNRSKAMQDAMRALISEWKASGAVRGEVNGAIVMIYEHDKPGLVDELLDIQHENEDIICSTMHIHLDPENCMEVIAVRGDAERIRALVEAMKTKKGVKHLKAILV